MLLLLFLTSTTRHVAAVVGGVGFGAFIDVLVDLALLATLRYMQVQERRMLATPSGS